MSAERIAALLLVATLGQAAQTDAATIIIVNTNAPNVGLNDPSPAIAAAGGDVSGTLGQQRLNVLMAAAEVWGRLLESDVPIRVAAQMINQTCGPGGTVLGSAGPVSLQANFANAPRPNTAYHVATANALAGVDLTPSANHINTNYNAAIDTGCSTGAVGWWYGTDPNEPVPADRIPLMPVVFHELGHGLGFSAQISVTTGNYNSSSPTVWSNFLYDLQTGQHWRSKTPAQRVASAINDPNLVWTGIETNRYSSRFLRPGPALVVNAPAAIAGSYAELQTAAFGPPIPATGITADLVVTDPIRACAPLANAAALVGRIALIERGDCNFTDKVERAQAAGAVAVLIDNNAASGLPPMGGASNAITIPSVGISQSLGNKPAGQPACSRRQCDAGHGGPAGRYPQRLREDVRAEPGTERFLGVAFPLGSFPEPAHGAGPVANAVRPRGPDHRAVPRHRLGHRARRSAVLRRP